MTKREHFLDAFPESERNARDHEAEVVARLWFAILKMPSEDKIEAAQRAYDALDEEGRAKAGYLFEELKKTAGISSPVFTKKS